MSTTEEHKTFIEGYWKGGGDPSNDEYPEPIPQPQRLSTLFIERLASMEKFVSRSENCYVDYAEVSVCRLCGCDNGSKEYRLSFPGENETWVWPEGFIHYIKDHNIHPSLRFVHFVHTYKKAAKREQLRERRTKKEITSSRGGAMVVVDAD